MRHQRQDRQNDDSGRKRFGRKCFVSFISLVHPKFETQKGQIAKITDSNTRSSSSASTADDIIFG